MDTSDVLLYVNKNVKHAVSKHENVDTRERKTCFFLRETKRLGVSLLGVANCHLACVSRISNFLHLACLSRILQLGGSNWRILDTHAPRSLSRPFES